MQLAYTCAWRLFGAAILKNQLTILHPLDAILDNVPQSCQNTGSVSGSFASPQSCCSRACSSLHYISNSHIAFLFDQGVCLGNNNRRTSRLSKSQGAGGIPFVRQTRARALVSLVMHAYAKGALFCTKRSRSRSQGSEGHPSLATSRVMRDLSIGPRSPYSR